MEVKKTLNNNVIQLRKKKPKCPNCTKPSKEPFVPFCSKNCANRDLIKWLSDENYINVKTD